MARRWNEATLDAIKGDFARPTVHARNLFHISIAMYDAWAAYDDVASTYFLSHTFREFHVPFDGVEKLGVITQKAREEALSYAVYGILTERFKDSPSAENSIRNFKSLMASLGYNPNFTSTDYASASPAALGNYIAQQVLAFGKIDGSNEADNYSNLFYQPVNPALRPSEPGNINLAKPNNWQPLDLGVFIDQSGRPTGNGTPPFLSPEWGKVSPFALTDKELNIRYRSGNKYYVYHDPGPPPHLNEKTEISSEAFYHWNFVQVAKWASHLDPNDGVIIDISPASNGNIHEYPETEEEYRAFYEATEGGNHGPGYAVNPSTGQPYMPQLVLRGDYTRVLAEFWADGPSSETPPGHWFSILNYVNSHPLLVKKIGGKGDVVSDLEWDVKSYFALAGALQDAAITAWGIKGFYDYVRPISAIRYAASKGQSSDPSLPNFHPDGLPLEAGYVESIRSGDPLATNNPDRVGKIKIYSRRGVENLESPQQEPGAAWILAEKWWPYQRTSFVTPPFAGYISGHSTFSRAAAEVLALITGDEFFPGGMSEFKIQKDNFLAFERGPSQELVIQWAKYQDASDQCSLSRIWGGIHPPIDDIPGRIIGRKIGKNAFDFASLYFDGLAAQSAVPTAENSLFLYPNPVAVNGALHIRPGTIVRNGTIAVYNSLGQLVYEQKLVENFDKEIEIYLIGANPGVYVLNLASPGFNISKRFVLVH
ncbi:hypothetical protein GCM10009119_22620 [Algoriphagus jejuensis]|uniref:Secreted protein (Por secretion system target) n=1 Tax=Algoriphagus jejuensis TaxID=419934 RepID=A0ABN1N0C6_9BACT